MVLEHIFSAEYASVRNERMEVIWQRQNQLSEEFRARRSWLSNRTSVAMGLKWVGIVDLHQIRYSMYLQTRVRIWHGFFPKELEYHTDFAFSCASNMARAYLFVASRKRSILFSRSSGVRMGCRMIFLPLLHWTISVVYSNLIHHLFIKIFIYGLFLLVFFYYVIDPFPHAFYLQFNWIINRYFFLFPSSLR